MDVIHYCLSDILPALALWDPCLDESVLTIVLPAFIYQTQGVRPGFIGPVSELQIACWLLLAYDIFLTMLCCSSFQRLRLFATVFTVSPSTFDLTSLRRRLRCSSCNSPLLFADFLPDMGFPLMLPSRVIFSQTFLHLHCCLNLLIRNPPWMKYNFPHANKKFNICNLMELENDNICALILPFTDWMCVAAPLSLHPNSVVHFHGGWCYDILFTIN